MSTRIDNSTPVLTFRFTMKLTRLLPVTFAFAAALLAQFAASQAPSARTNVVPPASDSPARAQPPLPAPSVIATTTPTLAPAAPAAPAPATATVAAAATEPRGETTLTLDVGFGIRAVPAARASLPFGDRLRLVAPQLGAGVNYIWTKNGQAIPGAPDSHILVLEFVASSDAGTYACLFSTPTTLPAPSQSLILGVGPTNRLLNLSTRGIVGPGPDQALTTGFVVGGTNNKRLILRAIGPSLAAFGVANPLRAPVLRIYDPAGRLYENGYAYPAVVGGLTYEADLAESLAKTGAFPLPANTRDATEMRPFDPGSYTATVTSADGTTGAVLLEIYEVP